MPSPNRLLGALALAACVLAMTAGAAQARTQVAVGLGDQSAAMFASPLYRSLKLTKTRYYIPWDAAKHPAQLAAADQYVAAAKARGVSVLMHISTNDFTAKMAKLPSVASYRKYVGALVRRYHKQGVKEWGVWNEENHVSQPTWRSPARAAQYFRQMRLLCKGCRIVALDILDQAGAERYVRRFMRAAGSQRRYIKYVGLHNYSDTNRKRSTGTAAYIRAIHSYRPRAQIWLTETGGVVSFGRSFPCSQSRAANRISYMFTLARRYNWQGTNCQTRFDSGLVAKDGAARKGYTSFKKGIAAFVR